MHIIEAVSKGDLAAVQDWLNNKAEPVTKHDCNLSLQMACQMGNIEIVNCLLEDEYKRADPRACNPLDVNNLITESSSNYALQLAIEYGAIEVVNRLLEDNRVNPAAANNNPLKISVFYGRTEIVARLLKDTRVNPAINQYEALRSAIIRGHDKVAKLLLNHQNPGHNSLNAVLPYLSTQKEKDHLKRLQAGYSFDKFGFFHHTILVSDVVHEIGLKLFQLEFKQ